MAECRSCGVLGNNETWDQQGDQDGKHDSEVLIQEVKQGVGCTASGKMRERAGATTRNQWEARLMTGACTGLVIGDTSTRRRGHLQTDFEGLPNVMNFRRNCVPI